MCAFKEGTSDLFEKDNYLPAACRCIAGPKVSDPEYLTYENGDHAIEVLLLITAFMLASSFGLIFKWFNEVVGEDLKPGATISVI